ncbi:hypothetical protein BDV34DRAFT_190739 [Aspergillus parasiticus]|uniref:Uncharacterized protein n=1 Tax=Aspergillus parasiticus TaxID=5067 RepID=A0A5N6DSW2_ASPPA|nr:hypothetical protein BDV34DRAFT_190739 [Aspergillus parasiticus]
MASIGPARCANLTGFPELLYPNTCGLPTYQRWNTAQNPYTTLQECCLEVNGTTGYFGEKSCAAYCNVRRLLENNYLLAFRNRERSINSVALLLRL